MCKSFFLVITSFILTIVLIFPVIFSMTQQQLLTVTELESKKPSEISDTFDFLEGIIEHDCLSFISSLPLKKLRYHQELTSDDFKVIFSPPPDLYI